MADITKIQPIGDSTQYELGARYLTTARILTIGNTGKTFNGTANVSWTITEILGSSDSTKFYRGDKTWSNELTDSFTAVNLIEKNGAIYLNNTTTNLIASNNGSSSTIYHSIWGQDKANRSWFCVEGYTNPNGSVAAFLGVRNYNTSGTAQSWKGITITEAKDNTLTYTVSDADKFRSAISVPSTTGGGASGSWGISITGNAATASKLGTSTIGTPITPIYLNAGNATETSLSRFHYDGNADWSSYAWHKVATCNSQGSYTDHWIKFLVTAGDNIDVSGILSVRLRCGSTGEYEGMQCRWTARTTSIPLDSFKLLQWAKKVELWCKMRGQWAGYIFRVLDGGTRAEGGKLYGWVLEPSINGHGQGGLPSATSSINSSDTPQYGAAWN